MGFIMRFPRSPILLAISQGAFLFARKSPVPLKVLPRMADAESAYMLDTNVFNAACDGEIPVEAFGHRKMLAIGVQLAELRATKNSDRRTQLLEKFTEIDPKVMPAESFAFDVEGAGWDQAKWNDGSGKFQKMLARLKDLDAASGKKPKDDRNQVRDILIAETALKLDATLISGDVNLRQMLGSLSSNGTGLLGSALTSCHNVAFCCVLQKSSHKWGFCRRLLQSKKPAVSRPQYFLRKLRVAQEPRGSLS
jgi:predicted nucleic acid-binding protein